MPAVLLATDADWLYDEVEAALGGGDMTVYRVRNGVDVLQHLIAPGSLTGFRLFFPDPWPKARHHKRRFLQPGTVGLIADRLLPGGVLHAATDHPGYAQHIAEVCDGEPRLCRVDPGSRLPISIIRPTTKYEMKAQDVGSSVSEFIWKRRSE